MFRLASTKNGNPDLEAERKELGSTNRPEHVSNVHLHNYLYRKGYFTREIFDCSS